MMGRRLNVLLVEDDEGDIRLIRECFNQGQSNCRLHTVGDGVEALAFLQREGAYAGSPRPDLILLDLNMPRRDGVSLLRIIKAQESLKLIPVVVLTTSQSAEDIFQCYRAGANCYVAKPLGFDEFSRVLGLLQQFWLGTAQLPTSMADAVDNALGDSKSA
jgi:chemotaxis family two-component system response regulator Rcp1